jgi:hypothetical protein
MASLSRTFEETPIDRDDVPQETLDIETRVRTNLFPWRGQFSPGLVDGFLSRYAPRDAVVLDPFAGVGTTLFEAARRGFSANATEINPAALAMAETIMFVRLSAEQRRNLIEDTETLLLNTIGSGLPLFFDSPNSCEPVPRLLADLGRRASSPYERNLLTNALIRLLDSRDTIDASSAFRAFRQHSEIVMHLPYNLQHYNVKNVDARQLQLRSQSVDLVVTSPPYINVFNYHQNNRPAMELLGWNLLEVAKSEFGSNRKNRGNRFLTVTQYCIDIYSAFVELRCVLKPSGRAIFVVGRESSVRGIPFENGRMVSALAEMAGFRLALRQERKFKNKFGGVIFEDILHLVPSEGCLAATPIELAVQELKLRLARYRGSAVEVELEAAIQSAPKVRPSPIYVAVGTAELSVA